MPTRSHVSRADSAGAATASGNALHLAKIVYNPDQYVVWNYHKLIKKHYLTKIPSKSSRTVRKIFQTNIRALKRNMQMWKRGSFLGSGRGVTRSLGGRTQGEPQTPLVGALRPKLQPQMAISHLGEQPRVCASRVARERLLRTFAASAAPARPMSARKAPFHPVIQ